MEIAAVAHQEEEVKDLLLHILCIVKSSISQSEQAARRRSRERQIDAWDHGIRNFLPPPRPFSATRVTVYPT
jgi:hypothetical protein